MLSDRSHRQARARRRRCRRRWLRVRDRQGARRGRRDGLGGDLAAGARHLHDDARARQDGRLAADARRQQARSSRRSIRSTPSTTASRTLPPSSARTAATATSATSRSPASPPRSRPTTSAARHRRPLASPTAPRSRSRCSRSRASGYLGAVSASAYSMVSMVQQLGPIMRARRLVPLALVHGRRARGAGLRRRHVVGEGRARVRHAHPRVRGRPQVGPPRQRDLRRPLRLARGERDRLHRAR